MAERITIVVAKLIVRMPCPNKILRIQRITPHFLAGEEINKANTTARKTQNITKQY